MIVVADNEMGTPVAVRYFSQRLVGVPYSPVRRGLNKVRPSAGSFLRALVKYPQKSDGVFAVFFTPKALLLVAHVGKHNEGLGLCAPKVFPKTEKEFPRVR